MSLFQQISDHAFNQKTNPKVSKTARSTGYNIDELYLKKGNHYQSTELLIKSFSGCSSE